MSVGRTTAVGLGGTVVWFQGRHDDRHGDEERGRDAEERPRETEVHATSTCPEVTDANPPGGSDLSHPGLRGSIRERDPRSPARMPADATPLARSPPPTTEIVRPIARLAAAVVLGCVPALLAGAGRLPRGRRAVQLPPAGRCRAGHADGRRQPGRSPCSACRRPGRSARRAAPRSGAPATRVVIPALGIDLPVVTSPPNEHFPLCNVAEYLVLGRALAYPGLPQATYLYAHARTGMFLPLLTQSQVNNGAAMIGMWVEVYTDDNQRHVYEISQVIRARVRLPRPRWTQPARREDGPAVAPDVRGAPRVVDEAPGRGHADRRGCRHPGGRSPGAKGSGLPRRPDLQDGRRHRLPPPVRRRAIVRAQAPRPSARRAASPSRIDVEPALRPAAPARGRVPTVREAVALRRGARPAEFGRKCRQHQLVVSGGASTRPRERSSASGQLPGRAPRARRSIEMSATWSYAARGLKRVERRPARGALPSRRSPRSPGDAGARAASQPAPFLRRTERRLEGGVHDPRSPGCRCPRSRTRRRDGVAHRQLCPSRSLHSVGPYGRQIQSILRRNAAGKRRENQAPEGHDPEARPLVGGRRSGPRSCRRSRRWRPIPATTTVTPVSRFMISREVVVDRGEVGLQRRRGQLAVGVELVGQADQVVVGVAEVEPLLGRDARSPRGSRGC